MSKETQWSEFYGEGEVVCNCDQCGAEKRFEFDDCHPDYLYAQRQLRNMGWGSCMVNGVWRDFCCEACRNKYIKSHT